MHSLEIKKNFIEFFKSKDHKVLPNVSLIPENDPTALFINSGVHPIVANILQGSHPLGKRLCSVQRCMRTTDIEEVGDKTHHTLFEMFGNWSIGDYFKKEAIKMSWEFLTSKKWLGLDPKRLYVSVFEGEEGIPRDEVSINVWKEIYQKAGMNAEIFDQKNKDNKDARIFPLSREHNWWETGAQTGPGGPDSEIFYYTGQGTPDFDKGRPGFNDKQFVEIWNNVFMEFQRTKEGKYIKLKQKNVDTGMGFERMCVVMQLREKDGSIPENVSNFNTDLFDTPLAYLRSLIEDESKTSTLKENDKYNITEFDYTLTNLKDIPEAVKSVRIIIDHLRACTFLIGDGVEPSNKDQGYILRRLVRRTVRHAKLLGIEQNITKDMAKLYIDKYKVQYPQLEENGDKILNTLEKEEVNFEDVIKRGVVEIDKLEATGKKITGKDLFYLYETYGYPIEMALDELGITDPTLQEKYTTEFEEAQKEHQSKSRKGAGKFKGGLADHTEISKRYHTATHLLLRALQMVLGDHVHQRGSNITEERLRFDFSHPDKLTDEQIKKVEKIVNEQIEKKLVVMKETMSKEKALKIGAECEFPEKYPDTVAVYSIKDPKIDKTFSQELCGGPHVEKLEELAESGKFKIVKEESSGSGIRRIKAVLQERLN